MLDQRLLNLREVTILIPLNPSRLTAMYFDPRAILFFGANVLLLHLCLMVNSALAGTALYLLLLGPMVVLPALYMRHLAYFLCTLASGLWVDAALPLPFGLFTIGLLAAGATGVHRCACASAQNKITTPP